MARSLMQESAASLPAPDAPIRLRFSGLSRTIHLPADAPELSHAVACILKGWKCIHEPSAAPERKSDLCYVAKDDSGTFKVCSSFVMEPLEALPVASAACAIAADLAQGYFEDRKGSLALHCGAFQIGNDLVALVGPARAGKSTLIARLAMERDLRIFCDDVLPVDDEDFGVALGISPRIRIPLPNNISARFRRFIDNHVGPADDQYGYIVADSVAHHGSRAPLKAIVALRRRPSARARLHRLSVADAVQLLAEQNMADLASAQHAFERISGLVDRLQRFTLVYSCLEEAVELLQRTFGKCADCPPADKLVPLLSRRSSQAPLPMSLEVRRFRWKRSQDVQCRELDGCGFLFRDGAKTLWRMNRLATAVWALLDEPCSIDDIAELISEVFPEAPRPKLQGDLISLFEMLAEERMIQKL